ncbi:hypothetical protein [Nonomuraea sp. NPDC050783]
MSTDMGTDMGMSRDMDMGTGMSRDMGMSRDTDTGTVGAGVGPGGR